MEFFRCNWALSRTVKYYEIGLIYTHMRIFAGKDPNGRTHEEMYKLMFTSYENMEVEINHVIHECKDNTRVLFFENLKDWLNYDLISQTNRRVLEDAVEKYNNEQYEQLEFAVNEKVKIMKNHPAYEKYEHNQEYPATRTKIVHLDGSIWNTKKVDETYTETNRKFYSIVEKIDVLDWAYFDAYVDKVDKLLNVVRGILTKYVKLYDEGKIILNQQKVIEIKALENKPHQQLLDTPTQQPKKLKTALTAGQIMYLFQTLESIGAFEKGISKVDMCRFIAANLSTEFYEDLSADNLAKKWSSINPNDIAFWYDKFPDMSKKVIKDNPNKIKHKPRRTK